MAAEAGTAIVELTEQLAAKSREVKRLREENARLRKMLSDATRAGKNLWQNLEEHMNATGS